MRHHLCRVYRSQVVIPLAERLLLLQIGSHHRRRHTGDGPYTDVENRKDLPGFVRSGWLVPAGNLTTSTLLCDPRAAY